MTVSSRSGQGFVQRPPTRAAQTARGWAFDVLVAVLVLPTGLPYVHREGIRLGWLTAALLVFSAVPLVFRRIWPFAVFCWVCLSGIGGTLISTQQWVPTLGVLVAMYTVAAQSPGRKVLVAAAVLELSGLTLAVRVHSFDWYAPIFVTGLVAAAVGLGLYSATRRDYLAELENRARLLEFERDQEGELAAAAERARIAREIHDIVAHHLTVIVALSDGLIATPKAAPERVGEVIRAVSATGRQALTDTRRLLGVLRDDTEEARDGDRSGQPGTTGRRGGDGRDGDGRGGDVEPGRDSSRRPVPGLADLDGLIARVRHTGLPVDYEVRGAAVQLSSGLQLTAYRIVQEALTNTLKHAGPGASAVVRVHYLTDELRLDVTDDGRGPGAAVAPSPGRGRGLAGMRERVQAFDGEFHSGPAVAGGVGWLVSARLRLTGETGPTR